MSKKEWHDELDHKRRLNFMEVTVVSLYTYYPICYMWFVVVVMGVFQLPTVGYHEILKTTTFSIQKGKRTNGG